MFRFSRKMIYAVEAVLYVALNGRDMPVQSRTITQEQQIPERYLEQVLQRLVRAQILRGVRGPRGGYRLARPARDITLGDIVRVIRNMDRSEDIRHAGATSDLNRLAVMPIFAALDTQVMERLDSVMLADLMRSNDHVPSIVEPERLLRTA